MSSNTTTSLAICASHEALVQIVQDIGEMLDDESLTINSELGDRLLAIADMGKKALAKSSSLIDTSALTRADKYALASRIISDISAEWNDAPNPEQWQKEHVEAYDSSMSFDELAAEVRSVELKTQTAEAESHAQVDEKLIAAADNSQ